MNKVILIGRLTKDAEVRYSKGDNPVAIARYTLAVNRTRKTEGQPDADFINCVAIGRAGEFAEKWMKKGKQFGVVGAIQTRNWTDDNGNKRYATEVLVVEQYFADGKSEGSTSGGWQTADVDDDEMPF